MVKQNMDLRNAAKRNGIPLWAIADVMKISEQTFLRILRKELPIDEKAKIKTIISDLSKEA